MKIYRIKNAPAVVALSENIRRNVKHLTRQAEAIDDSLMVDGLAQIDDLAAQIISMIEE